MVDAIATMVVRGAPLIGAAAACGLSWQPRKIRLMNIWKILPADYSQLAPPL